MNLPEITCFRLKGMIRSNKGVFFLLILNAIRVTILFEINNEGAPAGVFDWWHSNFKYLFYIGVIALWMIWLYIVEHINTPD